MSAGYRLENVTVTNLPAEDFMGTRKSSWTQGALLTITFLEQRKSI